MAPDDWRLSPPRGAKRKREPELSTQGMCGSFCRYGSKRALAIGPPTAAAIGSAAIFRYPGSAVPSKNRAPPMSAPTSVPLMRMY